MKTQYFKVTTSAQTGKICGEMMVSTILDVQELRVEKMPCEWRPDPIYRVEPLGERQRAVDSFPLHHMDLHKDNSGSIGKSIGECLICMVFSHFLLSSIVDRFRKALIK